MLNKPLTYIRSSGKDHGLKNQIEGLGRAKGYDGKKVLLIEDLISTGMSSIKAVKAIQKNTLMKGSYRKVKKGRSIEYIVFKLNDWGEPLPEWKEKMKRIDAIIKRSYGEDY